MHSRSMAKVHDPKFWARACEALRGLGIEQDQQTAIAKLIGVKQPSVFEWEHGKSMPSIANVTKLALKTNVTVEWLYTNRGPKHPGPPGEPLAQRLWSLWGRLGQEEKAELVGYAAVRAAQGNGHLKAPKLKVG